jgi:hypothetical protein
MWQQVATIVICRNWSQVVPLHLVEEVSAKMKPHEVVLAGLRCFNRAPWLGLPADLIDQKLTLLTIHGKPQPEPDRLISWISMT